MPTWFDQLFYTSPPIRQKWLICIFSELVTRKAVLEPKKQWPAGELAQCLGALVALPGDQGSIPTPTWWLMPISNSSSKGSKLLVWPPLACTWYTAKCVYYVCRQNTHTHKVIIRKQKPDPQKHTSKKSLEWGAKELPNMSQHLLVLLSTLKLLERF